MDRIVWPNGMLPTCPNRAVPVSRRNDYTCRVGDRSHSLFVRTKGSRESGAGTVDITTRTGREILSRFSALRVHIEWHDANYQILEPFSYLPNVETNVSGVPPIYVKYLRKSSQGQEPNRSQRSYHDLQILVWSQCDSIANLGQAWAYLKKSDGSQKRSEAWDIISGHGYENCVQQVCPRLLYKAWECIENGNLEDLQDRRSSLLRTIEDLATSRKRRWEILEWPRSKEVGGRAAQGGAPDNTLSFSI
jgi:hypothetical protein